MKERWKKIYLRSLIVLIIFGLMIFQTSVLAFSVEGVKVNLIYTIIITIMLLRSVNFALVLSLCVGFVYDILSSNEMGFYMASYFMSIFPLTFWIHRIRSNLILSLFLIIVFVLATFKLFLEMMLLAFIYDIGISFLYFKGLGLLEVVLTTFVSLVPYGFTKIWGITKRRNEPSLN